MLVDKLMGLNYTDKEIDAILTNYAIGRMRKSKVQKLVEELLIFLKQYGYSNEDIVKITKSHPQIYGYSVNNIKQKINFLEELGYSKLEIINITKKCPQIYSLAIDNIIDKVNTLEELGYCLNEILSMICRFPQLLTLSNEYIVNKFNNLLNLGFTCEEIIKITKKLPQMWSLTVEKISAKKEFYDLIGISSFMLDNANFYMQSVDLSYARYMFLTSKGNEINNSNARILFAGQKYFEKTYKKSNSELINEYVYDIEEVKKRIK